MKRLAFVALLGAIGWVGLSGQHDTRSSRLAPKLFSDPAPVTKAPPIALAAPMVAEMPQAASPTKLSPIDFDALKARFGAADSDTTTAYDNPRPPLVTRSMIFGRHRLKVMMLADGKVGDPPPYKGWLLIGLLDPKTNSVLSDDEVQKRLAAAEPPKSKRVNEPTNGIILTATAIAAAMVQESRSAYYATGRPCACPDDVTRRGRRCGGNSAYSRPGGAQPLCYPHDVSARRSKITD